MKQINKIFLGLALGVALIPAFTSCTDAIKALPLEYKEDPNFNAPDIKAEWELEEMNNSDNYEYVFVYQDRLFDRLFSTNLGWNGGSNMRTFGFEGGYGFFFNTAYFGAVDAETRARAANNSSTGYTFGGLVGDKIETANELMSTTEGDAHYYNAFPAIRHPKASVSDQEMHQKFIAKDADYYYENGPIFELDGKVYQILNGFHSTGSGKKQVITFENMALVEYSKAIVGGVPTILNINHEWRTAENNPYRYGNAVFVDGEYVYLFGLYEAGTIKVPVLSRVKGGLDGQAEYFIKDVDDNESWITHYPTAEEMAYAYINEVELDNIHVFAKDGFYYIVGASGKNPKIMRSEQLTKGWSEAVNVFTVPTRLDKLGTDAYGSIKSITVHPALSRDGELVFAVDTAPKKDSENYNTEGSADFVRPWFFRVFKWERYFSKK